MAGPDIDTEDGQSALASKLDADFSGLAQSKGISLRKQAELGKIAILSMGILP